MASTETQPERSDDTITYNIRHYAKRLIFEMFWFLVFAGIEINCDEFVWNVFLLQSDKDGTSTSRHEHAMNFEHHDELIVL